MSELIEVVFENISQCKVCSLLMRLLNKSGAIEEISCNQKIKLPLEGVVSKEFIERFMELHENDVLIIRVNTLKIVEIIPNVQLRLVKYENKYDIDFTFDSSDINQLSIAKLMRNIHPCISKLSLEYDVNNWFSGIEPADDEDTRYFTKNKLSPLSIKNNIS